MASNYGKGIELWVDHTRYTEDGDADGGSTIAQDNELDAFKAFMRYLRRTCEIEDKAQKPIRHKFSLTFHYTPPENTPDRETISEDEVFLEQQRASEELIGIIKTDEEWEADKKAYYANMVCFTEEEDE